MAKSTPFGTTLTHDAISGVTAIRSFEITDHTGALIDISNMSSTQTTQDLVPLSMMRPGRVNVSWLFGTPGEAFGSTVAHAALTTPIRSYSYTGREGNVIDLSDMESADNLAELAAGGPAPLGKLSIDFLVEDAQAVPATTMEAATLTLTIADETALTAYAILESWGITGEYQGEGKMGSATFGLTSAFLQGATEPFILYTAGDIMLTMPGINAWTAAAFLTGWGVSGEYKGEKLASASFQCTELWVAAE